MLSQLNQLILANAGLAGLVATLLFFAKDFLRDFLARDAQAKLADKDPSNDKLALVEQSLAMAIDNTKKPK